jgi:hypothetical protein
VVFTDVPGHITPRPVSRTLGPGGSLIFTADYAVTPTAARAAAAATPAGNTAAERREDG